MSAYTKTRKGKVKRRLKKEVRYFLFGVLLSAIVFFVCFRTAATANAGTPDSFRHKYYTSIEVEAGTSLWELAMEYMSEEYASAEEYIDEVKEMNHLQNDKIYEGAYLCIPYYSSEYK